MYVWHDLQRVVMGGKNVIHSSMRTGPSCLILEPSNGDPEPIVCAIAKEKVLNYESWMEPPFPKRYGPDVAREQP